MPRAKTVDQMPLTAVVAAFDTYIEKLLACVEGWRWRDQRELADIEAEFREALGGWPAIQLDPFIAKCRAVIEETEVAIRRMSRESVIDLAHARLGSTSVSFWNLLVPTGGIEAAENRLAEAQQVLKECRAQMEDLIAHAKVDEILVLRGRLEVGLPSEVAHARAAVIEQRLAYAQAAAAEPLSRTKAAKQREETARRELERAKESMGSAEMHNRFVQSAGESASAIVAALEKELIEAKDDAAIDRTSRLRALAGLPAEVMAV